jgi:hypothetical protein
VWALKKNGAFRDSAQDGLQTSSGIHMKKYSHTHSHVYTGTTKSARCICKLRLMADSILGERSVHTTIDCTTNYF